MLALIYDIIRAKNFEEIYLSFYFLVSIIEYSLKRCYSDTENI